MSCAAAAKRPCRRLARDRSGVPRVRTGLDDRCRRLSESGLGALPQGIGCSVRAQQDFPRLSSCVHQAALPHSLRLRITRAICLVSGPAGGAVGAARLAAAAGVRRCDRLRHGRYLDGCVPGDRRRRRARTFPRSRWSPDLTSDGRHPHGRGWRRIDRLARRRGSTSGSDQKVLARTRGRRATAWVAGVPQ